MADGLLRRGVPMERDSVPRFDWNGMVADFRSDTLRDAAGRVIPLRPQAFAVFRHLAANPDRLVTKDELLGAVWPGIAVTDDSLVQCIGDIRRAIGDEAHAVLRTVPRRGYRLVPPGPEPASEARPRRRWVPAAAAALALTLAAAAGLWMSGSPRGGVPLVAVLPFEAVGEDKSARLLARGLTDDVITDLTRFSAFEVLARSTTEAYADADPRRVGEALHAGFVVDGSIAREADRIRVTAQLLDAATGASLWADRWERPAADLFDLQTEIAETIANRLPGVVADARRTAARRKPPASLDAYELYLLGSERVEMPDQLGREELEAGLAFLGRAVERDPGFARAWAEMSHAHSVLANRGVEPQRNRDLALEKGRRAVALDPNDAVAHAAYANGLGIHDDFARAEAEFDVALRLAPNSADIIALYLAWAPSFEDAAGAAELVERAIRLRPNYPLWMNRPFSYTNFMAGRYETSLGVLDRLGFDHYSTWTWSAHAGMLAALGRHDEAAAVVEKALAAHPDLSIELMANEPGFAEHETDRFVEVMRLADFPACAAPEALAGVERPRRLPECEARAAAP